MSPGYTVKIIIVTQIKNPGESRVTCSTRDFILFIKFLTYRAFTSISKSL
jgi:hypothetical protein